MSPDVTKHQLHFTLHQTRRHDDDTFSRGWGVDERPPNQRPGWPEPTLLLIVLGSSYSDASGGSVR